MKFKIYEMLLNEYVNHPTLSEIGQIEDSSIEEAKKFANMNYQNRGPLHVEAVKNSSEK
jgi:hypothetical protein